MNRPNPNLFRTPATGVPVPDPVEPVPDTEPYGAAAPGVGADPADSGAAPMGGDVPPMTTPSVTRRFDAWNYREDSGVGDGSDLVGFRIEATDGHIGKIDEASALVGEQYLVVDTGPWIFGKKVLLPAGTVNRVDQLEQRIYVDRTKSQIKDAPQFEPDTYASPEYREKVGGYYGSTYERHR
ncbi:hypothetical protein GCM10023322_18460 [Rugosimonospora acidiphila]|uniref:PRC-barrel domain containing protein n=1 Tax=Rugosimonospora acidiphila TaxID=556531 RepID=A0ABP9RQA9_9ACTN